MRLCPRISGHRRPRCADSFAGLAEFVLPFLPSPPGRSLPPTPRRRGHEGRDRKEEVGLNGRREEEIDYHLEDLAVAAMHHLILKNINVWTPNAPSLSYRLIFQHLPEAFSSYHPSEIQLEGDLFLLVPATQRRCDAPIHWHFSCLQIKGC